MRRHCVSRIPRGGTALPRHPPGTGELIFAQVLQLQYHARSGYKTCLPPSPDTTAAKIRLTEFLLLLRVRNAQSLTVQDVDLSADDVSRLRQAWAASTNQASRGSSESPSNGDGERRETGACTGSGTTFAVNDYSDNGDDLRLVYGGKDLQEGRPLSGYGLSRDSTVHVLGRLRGGAQLGKVVKGRSQVCHMTDGNAPNCIV